MNGVCHSKEEMKQMMTKLNLMHDGDMKQKINMSDLFENATEIGDKVFLFINVANLRVDNKMYQRPVQSHVKKLADNWQPEKYDPLIVNYRGDGYFYIIDGQHRFEAAKMLNINKLVCSVYVGLTIKEEATIFAEQDRYSKKLTPFDTYKANLCREEEIDTAIEKVCQKFNIKVEKGNLMNQRYLTAPTHARKAVVKYGAEALDWTFSLLDKTNWCEGKMAYGYYNIDVFSNIYGKYQNNLPFVEQKLIPVMREFTLKELLAQGNIKYPKYSPAIQLKLVLEDFINKESSKTEPAKTRKVRRLALA